MGGAAQGATGARACGQGPCGADSEGVPSGLAWVRRGLRGDPHLLALDVNSHPGSMSIVTKARRGTAPQRRLSHTLTWLRRLWASLRDPERCPECGLTHRKADIVRCPCDWRDGHDI
jgi:hypothetical protein